MKIKVTRAFFLRGEVQSMGTELDVDDRMARELIHNGKAEAASVAEVAAVAEKPAASPKAKKETKE